MSEKNRQTLLVFARHPERGRVKKRLAEGIGQTWALAIYRQMLSTALDVAHRHAAYGRRVILWVDPAHRLEAFRRHWAKGLRCEAQKGRGLGERLSHAFEAAWAEGASRVAVMGTDCPRLHATAVEGAFRILYRTDAVLGPAADGGYYLLGLARPVPGVFRDIPWSTPEVLGRTIKCLRRSGISPALLPALFDIDRAEDLIAAPLLEARA